MQYMYLWEKDVKSRWQTDGLTDWWTYELTDWWTNQQTEGRYNNWADMFYNVKRDPENQGELAIPSWKKKHMSTEMRRGSIFNVWLLCLIYVQKWYRAVEYGNFFPFLKVLKIDPFMIKKGSLIFSKWKKNGWPQ